jgi:hypothetical protein
MNFNANAVKMGVMRHSGEETGGSCRGKRIVRRMVNNGKTSVAKVGKTVTLG